MHAPGSVSERSGSVYTGNDGGSLSAGVLGTGSGGEAYLHEVVRLSDATVG